MSSEPQEEDLAPRPKDPRVLNLSLVSHTNVGKTTLARTLVKGEVGEVLDQAHVTDRSDAYTLIVTPDGERLELWDTPGFGDSARLLRRLQRENTRLGWLLTQVWDRFSNRALYCSQQAIKNVKDEADVVLYLVNAAEDPEDAGYVDIEMEVLGWIGRPVLLLLNQTGPARPREDRQRDLDAWKEYTARFEVVRDVLELDAFSRCWVQEGVLLRSVGDLLPPDRRMLLQRLLEEWRRRSVQTFEEAMGLLAAHLARAACDRESLEKSGADLLHSARRNAMKNLALRLEGSLAETVDGLLGLHQLQGQAAVDVRARIDDYTLPPDQAQPWKAGAVGGAISGALSGVGADLLSGGLTFGAGALAGAVLGFFGIAGVSKGLNVIRGRNKKPEAAWSHAFLDGLARDICLRYLAVAHFGRGTGLYRERKEPSFWREEIETRLKRADLTRAWTQASPETPDAEARVRELLQPELTTVCRDVLTTFHPSATTLLP